MRNRMYREHDAIRHANLSHEFGYVCFHRALLDLKRSGDFLVSAACHQHREYLSLPDGAGALADRNTVPEDRYACSTNMERTRLGAQTEPDRTVRIARTSSSTDATSSTKPFAPAAIIFKIEASSRLHPITMTSRLGRSAFRMVRTSMTFFSEMTAKKNGICSLMRTDFRQRNGLEIEIGF
jgi:hypothetical protein